LVREVLEESRQEFPRYKKDGTRHKKNWVKRQCQVCSNWVPSSQIAVDHIDPVISVEHGKQDWNIFIDRLWCNTSGKANLQRICDPCHDLKTATERIARLTKQYTQELNDIENALTDCFAVGIDKETAKTYKKTLSKYTAKKKTIGLEDIVKRAQSLKDRLNG
jgi:chaperonin cofactor prefoldin